MGTIKDRHGKYLTEAEDTNRGGKNTQKYYTKKKDLNYPDNQDGCQNVSGKKAVVQSHNICSKIGN